VLIVGGYHADLAGNSAFPNDTELFDPTTGTFSVMDTLSYGISSPQLAMMNNGQVFVAGQYEPPMNPPPAANPAPADKEMAGKLEPMDVGNPGASTITAGTALFGDIAAYNGTRVIVIYPRPNTPLGPILGNVGFTNWGHVALWISRNGNSTLFDFGRYRPDPPTVANGEGSIGTGILRVWNDYKSIQAYLNHENSASEIMTFSMRTSESEENGMIKYFNSIIALSGTTPIPSYWPIELNNNVSIYSTPIQYQMLFTSCVTMSNTALALGLNAGGMCINEGFTPEEIQTITNFTINAVTPINELIYSGMNTCMINAMNAIPDKITEKTQDATGN
jgi:hypothetical protein